MRSSQRLVWALCAALTVLFSAPAEAGRMTLVGAGKVSSGGTYDPSSKSPKVWIDPRTGVTCTSSPCNGTNTTLSSIASAGSIGVTWSASASRAGTYISSGTPFGLPAIRSFKGGTDVWYTSGNVSISSATTRTIVFAAKTDNSVATGVNVIFGQNVNGSGGSWGVALPSATSGNITSGQVYAWSGGSISPFGGDPPQVQGDTGGLSTDTNWHIYLVVMAGSAIQRVEVDGVNVGTLSIDSHTAAPAASATLPMHIGVQPGSANFDVTIAQALVFDNLASPTTDGETAAQWISCKTGIPLSGGVATCP